MSNTEFDKFNLEGLSLEDAEPVKTKKLEPVVQAEPITPVEQPNEAVVTVHDDENSENKEDLMTCPKCELEQPKAEQCSGCGVYVEKALALIGQSKIEITSTKF